MKSVARIWVVFAKEVVDNARDRRSVTMAAIYPLMGPLLLGVLLTFAQGMFRPDQPGERASIVLAVRGAAYAPALISFLEENNVEITPAPEDLRHAVRYGDTELALIIPEQYPERFAAQRPATVHLVINVTRLATVMNISRTVGILRRYTSEVSTGRLKARGIAPEVALPLNIETINVGMARSLSGFFLLMIPPFLIFTIFIGGVYLALDTTSGERERGSLEPLLTNPLARWEFMLGKVWAAFVFTMGAVIIQLLAFKVMFDLVLEADAGINVSPAPLVLFNVFLVSIPIMLLAVALQVIIATVTRSFKESQTYLGLLPLIPSVPGMVLIFVTVKAQLWMMSIPTFSQVILIGQLVRGDPVSMTNVIVSVGATTMVAVALLFVAGRLYNREELLFSA